MDNIDGYIKVSVGESMPANRLLSVAGIAPFFGNIIAYENEIRGIIF